MESTELIHKISFQLIHQEEIYNEIIEKSLKESYEEFYLEKSETEIEELLSYKYTTNLHENKFLTGFTISIDDIDVNNYETFIDNFVRTIKENENTVSLIKLSDETRFTQYVNLYKEIAHIEMQLREILTYIFYKEYPDTPFNVLGDYPVKLLKDLPSSDEFKNRMENEFFYLVFSDYISLEKPKEISNIKDLNVLLESSDSFENFKEKITKRGISNERHQDFLASLKSNLDTIEKVRNSVAHNRTISERPFGHYESAKTKLVESFSEFWNNIDQDSLLEDIENSSTESETVVGNNSLHLQTTNTSKPRNKKKKKKKKKRRR